jgi:hypothetical protein
VTIEQIKANTLICPTHQDTPLRAASFNRRDESPAPPF